jgi:hypothetical protein
MLYYKFPIKTFNKKLKKTLTKMLNIRYKDFIMIKALSLGLDIDFGYYSYDKLRNLFTLLVTNELYQLPDERTALLEYKRILSCGMAGMLYNINFRIINNPKLLLSKFDKIEDKNLLKDNVIFLSIYNSIRAS